MAVGAVRSLSGRRLDVQAEKCEDPVCADRAKMVGVHPDIIPPEPLRAVLQVITHPVMLMAVQMDAALIKAVPFEDGVMEKHPFHPGILQCYIFPD